MICEICRKDPAVYKRLKEDKAHYINLCGACRKIWDAEHKKPRKFAETTSVPLEKSQEEICHSITGPEKDGYMGADQYAAIWETSGEVIRFRWRGLMYHLDVPAAKDEQDRRRLWRGMHLFVKAMLVASQNQVMPLEKSLLSALLLPNGQTVGDTLPAEVRTAFEAGLLPKRLLPALNTGEE